MWDAAAHVENLPGKVRMLDDACREVGRDPSTIRRQVHVAGTEAVSSPDAFLAFYEKHRAMGFTDFVTDFPGLEQQDSIRRIATEVIPSLRQ
jgi:hypothetical protein